MQNFIPRNLNFQKMIVEKMKGNHFMNFIGFKSEQIEPGMVSGNLTILEHHKQQIGYLHGGVTATLADLVGGFAAFTLVEPNQAVVTAEMKVSYLNPGLGDTVFAKGYVIKAGSKLIFTECEIWVLNGELKTLVAKGYATYAVIQLA